MKDEIKSFLIQIKGNDEWKEIYDYITNLQDKYKEADYDRHKLFEAKEKLQNDYQEAVDKITNLQEENQKLHKELDYADNYNIYLISKIDKAIEEIKKRSTKEVADLYINILQGKSDE